MSKWQVDKVTKEEIERCLRAAPEVVHLDDDADLPALLFEALTSGQVIPPTRMMPIVRAERSFGVKMNVCGAARGVQYMLHATREAAGKFYGISVSTVAIYWNFVLLLQVCPHLLLIESVGGIGYWPQSTPVILELFGMIQRKKGGPLELVDGGSAFLKFIRQKPLSLFWGNTQVRQLFCVFASSCMLSFLLADCRPRRFNRPRRHRALLACPGAHCANPHHRTRGARYGSASSL